jgi:hypothetical protein
MPLKITQQNKFITTGIFSTKLMIEKYVELNHVSFDKNTTKQIFKSIR